MAGEECPVCSQPAPHTCSACHLVAYCGRDHQKQHWSAHKEVCRPFREETSAVLGRHLLATRDLQPGDVILSEQPLVVAPGAGQCLGCGGPEHARCPNCGWAACATPMHAPECAVLSVAGGRAGFNPLAVAPLRCLLLQRRRPEKWKQLLKMEAHLAHRGPGTEAYRESRDVANYLRENFLLQLPRLQGEPLLEDVSAETIARVCGVLDVNALEAGAEGAEAVALYPTAYLLEHSCTPNTRHSFDLLPGPRQHRITIRAAARIRKGDHINTMYTHALWGTAARQEHLLSTKHFTCRCQRCADPTELGTNLSAVKCLGNGEAPCDGYLLPMSPLELQTDWRCTKCPVSLGSGHVAELVSRIGDQIDAALQGSPTVKQLEDLLEKIGHFLHPQHYHCFSVKHSLVQLYGQQQGYQLQKLSESQLQRKEDMCRELLGVTSALDPGSARLCLYSSVLQVELHTALLERHRRTPSLHLLVEAQELLKKASGDLRYEPEGSPGSRLAELVQRAQENVEALLSKQND